MQNPGFSSVRIETTGDGSQTVYSEQFQEGYHSVHGAVTESEHIFIDAGFRVCQRGNIRIFEAGFGTGLNAYLTFIEAAKRNVTVDYRSIELFPLDTSVIDQLNYPEFLASDTAVFKVMHDVSWNSATEISTGFCLRKIKADLLEFEPVDDFDLVYFDAFSPVQQPALWSEAIFKKLYTHMSEGGILVTYCAKGIVRRTLEKVGFVTERLPGPPGKREMLRARK
jgi:tRNA U34 5-methylaminomethyl-2-thiouridine-forming methyltransferase MnmC